MKRAFLYARVSSKEQEKEGFSIPAQIKLLNEYALKNEIAVAQEFTDSETAKKAGRGNFLAMVEKLKTAKDVKIILVEKTDRLTRNFQDYVLIDELIQNLDIEVHIVKEGEILSKHAKSHTKLVHGIKVVLAKNFIDNLSEETSKGMSEKAAQGHWPTTAPYGYRNNTQTRLVEVDPDKSIYVKRAFELYATGAYSIKKLVQQLHDEGFIFRPSTAKPSTSNLHHILTNIFYTGRFVFRGIERVGHHPPLITASLFKTVQAQLKKANKPKYTKRMAAYANLLTCGYCGCNITADIKQNGRYVYYRCTHYKQKCPDKYIREESLRAMFTDLMKSLTVSADLFQWMSESLRQVNSQRDKEVLENIEAITHEISRINKRLSQLYDDKLDDLIDTELYKRKASEGKNRLAELEAQLSHLNRASEEQSELGLQILEFAKNAYILFSEVETTEQAKLLRIVLSKCALRDGKLYPVYNRPFDVLAQNPKSEKWYPQGNSNPCRLREREVS